MGIYWLIVCKVLITYSLHNSLILVGVQIYLETVWTAALRNIKQITCIIAKIWKFAAAAAREIRMYLLRPDATDNLNCPL